MKASEAVLAPSSKPRRLTQLDGLRGWAAGIVLLGHSLSEVFPEYTQRFQPFSPVLEWVSRSPLHLFVDGPLVVQIFFVLSGFVIAKAASRGHYGLVRNLVVRYLRLTIPIAASILFGALCFFLWAHAVTDLRAGTQNIWICDLCGKLSFTPREMLLEIFGSTFLRRQVPLNPVLWTMRFEFIGSCSLYFIYLISSRRLRLTLLCILAVSLLPLKYIDYSAFLVGALIFEFWSVGKAKLRNGTLLFVFGVLLPEELTCNGLYPERLRPILVLIGASSMVYLALLQPLAIRLFSAGISRFLGRVSFPLYLTHWSLLFTLGATIYLRAGANPLAALATEAILIPTALAVAFLGEIWIDAPTMQLLRRIDFHIVRAQAGTATGIAAKL